MKSQSHILYFVHDAELLEDGVLRVGFGGSDGERLVDGVHDVSPDSPDYKFWLWLRERRKRRWFQFGPISGLDEQSIAKFREEYERACA
jgi:hypothetical protein